MIYVDTIKKEAVCKYELTSHLYTTTVVSVEQTIKGVGLSKTITFRGLQRVTSSKNPDIYVDDTTEFKMECSNTVTSFDDIPFGSIIKLSLKVIIKETYNTDGELIQTLEVSRPMHVQILKYGYDEYFKPYIKGLPSIDTDSHVTVYEQYRALGYEYDKMCKIQQERLDKLERKRLKNKQQGVI